MNQPADWRWNLKALGVFIIASAVTLGLVIGIMAIVDVIRGTNISKEEILSFKPMAAKYAELCVESMNSMNFRSDFPQSLDEYKIVIVDWQTGTLDNEFFRLNKQYRAAKPEEVTTLVCVDRQTKYRFSYTSGGSAYRHEWHFVAIDYPNKWSKTAKILYGGEPPKIKSLAGDAYGSEPKGKIAEFCERYALLKGDI
jgi:hypothetical protein